jgi:hypothetical protein
MSAIKWNVRATRDGKAAVAKRVRPRSLAAEVVELGHSPSRLLYRLEAGGYSASSRMTLIRSDLPSKPIPGSSGIVI